MTQEKLKRNIYNEALFCLKCRNFSRAIDLLESCSETFRQSFEYHVKLGIAYLYIGDTGCAMSSFSRARSIKITDTELLLAQAAIFLQRGEIDRALEYYLDALETDENNKTASRGLDFIKGYKDYDQICKMIDSGEIKKFYPPLGVNPKIVARSIVLTVFLAAFIFFAVHFNLVGKVFTPKKPLSENLKSYTLLNSEKLDLTKDDQKLYQNALDAFQSERYNHAKVFINQVLLSQNVEGSVKEKAAALKNYIPDSTFETLLNKELRDNIDYKEVARSPETFKDCFAVWSGRIANYKKSEDATQFDLVIGEDSLKVIYGLVKVDFEGAQNIDDEQPIEVFGKISIESGNLILKAQKYMQKR